MERQFDIRIDAPDSILAPRLYLPLNARHSIALCTGSAGDEAGSRTPGIIQCLYIGSRKEHRLRNRRAQEATPFYRGGAFGKASPIQISEVLMRRTLLLIALGCFCYASGFYQDGDYHQCEQFRNSSLSSTVMERLQSQLSAANSLR